MEEILKNIKIIHASDALISEGIIPERARDLSTLIDYDGVQSDPIVVAETGSKYIVLDGMHRVEALRVLGCRDILVYLVNYADEHIILGSWDAIIKKKQGLKDLIENFSKSKGLEFRQHHGDVRELLYGRHCYFGFKSHEGRTTAVTRGKKQVLGLDEIITTLEECEELFDEKGITLTYLADTLSEATFRHAEDSLLMIRPRFTKEEVVSRTLSGKLFPRKTTRHIIPSRPLKVNVKISLLSENIDISIKNRLLQAELKRLNDHGRIRFYPDSIFLFNE
ncbi:MAG: ParB N-terminal domain-containing protein [Candidatus Glassbacteria bacterium]